MEHDDYDDLENGKANNDQQVIDQSGTENANDQPTNTDFEIADNNAHDLEMGRANAQQTCSRSEIEFADDLETENTDDQRTSSQLETENTDDQPTVLDQWGSGNNTSTHLYLRRLPYRRQVKIDYLEKGRPLHEAASNGMWDEAEKIFMNDLSVARAYITEGWETPLHVAALENQAHFVNRLIERYEAEPHDVLREVLEIKNRAGNTALCLAVVSGNVDIADALMRRHSELGQIRGENGILPVIMAARLGNKAMVEKLFRGLSSTFKRENQAVLVELMKECISSDLYGIARELIDEHLELAFSDAEVVAMLARKPMAEKRKMGKLETFFCSARGMKEAADSPEIQALELLKHMLECAFKKDDVNIENIVEEAPHLLFDASERGNFHCFKLLISYYPELVWKTDTNCLSSFHYAVKHHRESIFALLHNMKSVRKLVTTYVDTTTGNNMLHLAATLAPKDKLNTVTGAAFQMQQAICWYKEVEKIVPPAFKTTPNKRERTPSDIFDENHESLLKEGEKWLKTTAKSCMLVAALNATVIFTSAFTVPGGNDSRGQPCLLNKVWFLVFSVSEVIGMLSSSTSILMFLSILTSRFNKYAFQRSLPSMLSTGVAALFISIASMLIAFCTAVILWYRHPWVPASLLFFACVPILYIIVQARLFSDLFHSTFPSISCSNETTSSTTKFAAH